MDMIRAYDVQIEKLEAEITRQAKKLRRRDFTVLKSVEGLGPVLAMTILFALMSLPRFAPQKARTGMMGWDDVTPLAGISPPAVQGMPLSASARSLHPLMCSC